MKFHELRFGPGLYANMPWLEFEFAPYCNIHKQFHMYTIHLICRTQIMGLIAARRT